MARPATPQCHPTYAGEVLLFASFALWAWHWRAVVVFAVVWVFCSANLVMKEARLSRDPACVADRARI